MFILSRFIYYAQNKLILGIDICSILWYITYTNKSWQQEGCIYIHSCTPVEASTEHKRSSIILPQGIMAYSQIFLKRRDDAHQSRDHIFVLLPVQYRYPRWGWHRYRLY